LVPPTPVGGAPLVYCKNEKTFRIFKNSFMLGGHSRLAGFIQKNPLIFFCGIYRAVKEFVNFNSKTAEA
jgi:hypothetical protein